MSPPFFGASNTDGSLFTAKINLNGLGTNWIITLFDAEFAAQGVTSLYFLADGSIFIFDASKPDQFVPLNSISIPEGYFNVAIAFKKSTKAFDLYFDNDLVYSGTGVASKFTDVQFTVFDATPGATLDIDNIAIYDNYVNPNDYITITPTNGAVEPGESEEITLNFNANQIPNGVFNHLVQIHSNDTETPKLELPVKVRVNKERRFDLAINEFLTTPPTPPSKGSASANEYVELLGSSITNYENLKLITIGGNNDQIGVIQNVFELGVTNDEGIIYLELSDELADGAITFFLVENFTGNVGDDLDEDDNGELDNTPWLSVVDAVAKRSNQPNLVYTENVVTQPIEQIQNEVKGASKFFNEVDNSWYWLPNDLNGAGLPGFANTAPVGYAIHTPNNQNKLANNNPEIRIDFDDSLAVSVLKNTTESRNYYLIK